MNPKPKINDNLKTYKLTVIQTKGFKDFNVRFQYKPMVNRLESYANQVQFSTLTNPKNIG